MTKKTKKLRKITKKGDVFVKRGMEADPIHEVKAITVRNMVRITNKILEKKEADWRFNIDASGALIYQSVEDYKLMESEEE